MLSTRFSVRALLRAAAVVAAGALMAGCAAQPKVAANDGISVDVNGPVKVALLLPYGTGDQGREQIARSLENAARLAQGDVQNATIDLVVYPTAGTTSGGAAAASQAVSEGAKIIIGPLFSTETAGAASPAAAAGLTLLSFSNNPSVAGSNVYILGTSFQNTADRLIAYGQAHGLGPFGVIYPSGLEGETARDAVREAAAGRGATVAASEAYSLSVAGIQSAAGPAAQALLAAGANGIILTDGPTGGLSFIADGLRSNGIDQDRGQFLGMQRWDISAEAMQAPSLQGGVFAAPDPTIVNAFNGRYRAAYGESPHELAGLAYDGVAAVGALIAEARSQGGSPFSTERLTQASGFAGVNGPFRFTASGRAQRNLAIVAVENGAAVVREPAARTFDTVGF
ncbi:MAG: penicillin-binding protein activator [Amaricoccus sp.]|uniref:penicillin-binding protein activator n=1 Tax=Amaricoccus sp. TaxID=1872485 RepID=UPI0039E365C6